MNTMLRLLAVLMGLTGLLWLLGSVLGHHADSRALAGMVQLVTATLLWQWVRRTG